MVLSSKEISLIGTGAAFGVFHVLTGPDHLSAIVTLSANVANCLQSFLLGIRWGIGHSTGLLLVGIIMILVTAPPQQQQQDDTTDRVEVPDWASTLFESLVGVFMILLGGYGIRRSWKKRPSSAAAAAASSHEKMIPNVSVETKTISPEDALALGFFSSYHNHASGGFGGCCSVTDHSALLVSAAGNNRDNNNDEEKQSELTAISGTTTAVTDHEQSYSDLDDDDDDEEGPRCCCCCYPFQRWFERAARAVSMRSMAVFAGIVHGLAGPGGVLGIIPAVQLHDVKLAAMYLSTFCVCSTVTMGLVALLYGTCSSKLGRAGGTDREFLIESLSAALSIVVGVTWLVLLSVGKLEDVFP